MKSGQEQIKIAAADLGTEVGKTAGPQVKAATDSVARKMQEARAKLGVSDAMMEALYGQAYNLYNTGNYKEAEKLFRTLMMMSAPEPRFTFGLGACLHMMKRYKDASKVYTMLALTDPNNPVPYYHAADCFIHQKDPLSTLMSLNMAIKYAGERPEYRVIRDRALLMREGISKELKITEKPK